MDIKADIQRAVQPLIDQVRQDVRDDIVAALEGIKVEVKVTLDLSEFDARLQAIRAAREAR